MSDTKDTSLTTKRRSKPTKEQMVKRIAKAEQYLSNGMRLQDAATALMKDFTINLATGKRYCNTVLTKWSEDLTDTQRLNLKNTRRDKIDIELSHLYEIAYSQKDVKTCLLVIDRQAKLHGLYEAEEVNVTHHQGVIVIPAEVNETQWLTDNKDSE